MPTSFAYDNDKKMLVITLEGAVLLDEIDQLYSDIVTSTEFPIDARAIWDVRKADYSLIDKAFLEKVFAIRKKYPQRGNAKAAFVADSDLTYGVTRMYEVLSSFHLPQNTIQTFRDFAEAEQWLLLEE